MIIIILLMIIIPLPSTTKNVSKQYHIDFYKSSSASRTVLGHDDNMRKIKNFNINRNFFDEKTNIRNFPPLNNDLLLSTVNNTIPNKMMQNILKEEYKLQRQLKDFQSKTIHLLDYILKSNVTKQQTRLIQRTMLPKSIKSLPLVEQENMEQQQNLHARSKRYLSFPEGSSFTAAVCFTVGIIGNPRYDYMSFGLNWGVAYDLPNATWILNRLHHQQHVPLTVWQHRSRRSLYYNIEGILDNMGYHGRDCVLRALCESRQYFYSSIKFNMIGEMLKAIFSLPKQKILHRELREQSVIMEYDEAYHGIKLTDDCSNKYKCHFSLLDLAFGKYSMQFENYDK